MKKFAIVLLVTLLSLSLSGMAIAKGDPKIVVNGGGIAVNNNSGLGVDLLSVGGFTAHMKGGNFKGQIQSKSVLAADPTTTIGSTPVWGKPPRPRVSTTRAR